MAVQTITYSDKSNINTLSDIPAQNKIQDTDMNQIKSVVNNNATILQGLNGSILWENESPTSAFATQTIALNNSNYDLVVWIVKRQKDQDLCVPSVISKKGLGGFVMGTASDGTTRRRGILYNSDISFSIGDSTSGSGVVDNDSLIPIYAIGIKTGLF